jgi:integrase
MPSALRSVGVPVRDDNSLTLPAGPDDRRTATFEQYARAWLDRRRRAGRLDWKHHERRLRLHAFPALGRERLSAITRPRMIAYARSLAGTLRADGSRPLSSRTLKNIADSVKAVLTDAVEDGLLPSNPCAWNARKHLPAVTDVDPCRRVSGFLGVDEIEALLASTRVPPLRRMAYALEFLTGLRPGEVAALRIGDVDLSLPPGGRIVVARAWSSDNKAEGPTKTKVAKVVPVHPALRTLENWMAAGFEQTFGRVPAKADLVVPAPRGGHRMASQTNREFQADLARLGLRKRVHSDARATFRSLVLAARPDLERFADLVTHPSPREAKDLYRRLDALWPRMCEAVAAIEVQVAEPVSRSRRGLASRREPRHRGGNVRVAIAAALDALYRGRVDLAIRGLRRLERGLTGPRPSAPPEHRTRS